MDPRPDAEVMVASLEHPARFATIFDRHAATVFRFLVRRVGRDTADELLGETFRIAFERRRSFDTAWSSCRPWLYGIATNLVAKHRRTEARRLRAAAKVAADRPVESSVDAVIGEVAASAAWPSVAHAIAELPDGERDALLLHAWEELSYEEIGVALGIPIGTVRSRLNRARGRIRELTTTSGEQQVRATDDAARIQP